jgi:hypothetical protein
VVERDAEGRLRLSLGQSGARLGLVVMGEDGADQIFAGTQPDFQGLTVWDQSHVQRGVLGVLGRNETITLRNPDGKIVFEQP